jgi:hypothetical protein
LYSWFVKRRSQRLGAARLLLWSVDLLKANASLMLRQ